MNEQSYSWKIWEDANISYLHAITNWFFYPLTSGLFNSMKWINKFPRGFWLIKWLEFPWVGFCLLAWLPMIVLGMTATYCFDMVGLTMRAIQQSGENRIHKIHKKAAITMVFIFFLILMPYIVQPFGNMLGYDMSFSNIGKMLGLY
ncbi:MAG TPA: hypothetical protein VM577_09330 [Anaerovoracaceae bacterium]|nr:hypothetical protein [Anaerovoracaceae bacterium]